jgi:hypothetical protein
MTDTTNNTPNPPTPCPRCEGCGQLANDDDRTPWTFWEQLEPPSNMAVTLGLVSPQPCPDCSGTGTKATTPTDPNLYIPAGVDLPRLMNPTDFQALLTWMRTNNVDPWRVTAERNTTITPQTITRYDVLGDVDDGSISGYRRDHGHTLRDGEEWTTDDDFAIVCHQVTTPVTTPLPDTLRAAVIKAIPNYRHAAAAMAPKAGS